MESLAPRSLRTWDEVKDAFHNKFFPPSKTAVILQNIMAFKQKPNETMVKVWERFKELPRSCPMHGQPPYAIKEIIYNALDVATKNRINT